MSKLTKEILPDSPYDISQRGATNTTLPQFKGKDRQIIVNVEDSHRISIMDGNTLGGKSSTALQEASNRFRAEQTFEKPIKITSNNVSGNEDLKVFGKSSHYDDTNNQFSEDFTELKHGLELKDKNDVVITQIQNTINANKSELNLEITAQETTAAIKLAINKQTKKASLTSTVPVDTTASGSEIATASFVLGKTGALTNLQTTQKADLVSAINELKENGSTKAVIVDSLDDVTETDTIYFVK